MKLFGTDGVRGIANTELTPEIAFKLGRAGAYVLTKENQHTPKIIIGKDTRLSGDMLECAMVAGMCSVGATVYCAGVVPTPGVAYLVRKHGLDAGVVISASHNGFADNGIKFFNGKGFKLADTLENEIEAVMNDESILPRPIGHGVGRKEYYDEFLEDYINFLVDAADGKKLNGLKIILDTANGATYQVAPSVFEELGADVAIIHNEPDGLNINTNCGSTHMESLVEAVKAYKADIGMAFDGDGDRCLLVDENGKLVDGDEIMSILGNQMKDEGTLAKNTIVATVMSNLGLFMMGDACGLHIEKTVVGDRYVLENMLENGYNLGGEQSGHVILLDRNTTGDGVLTALQIALLLKKTGKPLSALNCYMKVMPQVLINVKVDNAKKNTYLDNPRIKQAVDDLTAKFANKGRVLVRASGTESRVRVMIEGPDQDVLEKEARALADIVEEELN